MLTLPDLLVFVTATLILLLTPGPAVFYIVGRTMDEGRLAGAVSILGISVGTLVHIAAAAFGVSIIFASSEMAFNLMKLAGAAYLIYLGFRTWQSKTTAASIDIDRKANLRSVFYQGIWVNLLNPKAALFFLAFLPQFVDPAAGNVPLQIILLGALFLALAITSDGVFVVLADALGNWLRKETRFLLYQTKFSAVIYILLGIATLFAGTGRKH